MAPGRKLLGVQAARGAAATIVAIYHSGLMVALPQYVGFNPLGDAIRFGHAGVDFFFVLSGFVIHYVHRRDFGDRSALPRYLWRRLVRVYPMYWLITAFVIALALASPSPNRLTDIAYTVKSVLLVPQWDEPLLGVGWTLTYEMFFYLVFATAIASRRLGAIVFTAWAALIVVNRFVNPGIFVLQFPGFSYHIQFFTGIAVSLAVTGERVAFPRLLATCGIIAFAVIGLAENAGKFTWAGTTSQVLFGLASGMIIAGLATAERRNTLHAGPRAAWFGAMSYVFYLVHVIVIGLAVRLLFALHIGQALPAIVVQALTVAAAIAVAAALHALVERPTLAWLHRLPARASKAVHP